MIVKVNNIADAFKKKVKEIIYLKEDCELSLLTYDTELDGCGLYVTVEDDSVT